MRFSKNKTLSIILKYCVECTVVYMKKRLSLVVLVKGTNMINSAEQNNGLGY